MLEMSIQAGNNAAIRIGGNNLEMPAVVDAAYWVCVVSRTDANIVLNNAYACGNQERIAKDLEPYENGDSILCVVSVNLSTGSCPHCSFEKIIIASGGGEKLGELEDSFDQAGALRTPEASYAFAGTLASGDDGFEALSTDSASPAALKVNLLPVNVGGKEILTTVKMQMSNAQRPSFVA